jgi:uncharacterized membrane protein YqjE
VATYNHSSAGRALDALPTSELLRQILDETRELVRIESRLAREEVRDDLLQLKAVAIFGSAALVLALTAISTLVMAVVLGLGGTAIIALAAAAVLLLAAAVSGGLAYQKLPKMPLQRTRDRLKSEVTQLKEHVQ